MNLESIYSALWDTVGSVTDFVTASRRLKHWDDIASEMMPALFMSEKSIRVSQIKGMPSKYEITADIFIYVSCIDKDIAPATVLNPLISAVCNALAPDINTGVQTLGIAGVSHAWVEGDIATDEGTMGDLAIAIIPVKILAV